MSKQLVGGNSQWLQLTLQQEEEEEEEEGGSLLEPPLLSCCHRGFILVDGYSVRKTLEMSVTVNSQWLQLTLQQQAGGSLLSGGAASPSSCVLLPPRFDTDSNPLPMEGLDIYS